MDDLDAMARLRHELANPLAALLAETQLLLLNEGAFDDETRTSLRDIERLAVRMRSILRGTVTPPETGKPG